LNNKKAANGRSAAAAGITLEDDSRIRVTGELNFDTVPMLIRQVPKLLRSLSGQPVIDCSGVTDCNSASLAFILEINRIMKDRDMPARFESLPEDMTTFARAYDADEELRQAGILPAAETADAA
jgi:ABC-type transporter Mla MlaB component